MAAAPLASQRAELLGRVAGSQLQLEALIATLHPVPAEMAAQLADTIAVQQEIAQAGPTELPALTRRVGALVAAAATSMQQARAAATAQSAAASLAETAAASRHAVQSALDYTHSLDLRFASPEDERAYRQRVAERDAYIATEQAKHSPAGDLNAAGATVGQMADAHAHGANGPEFDQRWNELVATTEQLRDAAKANGVSTEEFDRRLRADLRRIMKAKGLSDADIDARFAATPDPLEAAKAFVGSDADLAYVERSTHRINAMSKPESLASQDAVKSLVASLQTAGVTAGAQDAAARPDHGVAVSRGAAPARSV